MKLLRVKANKFKNCRDGFTIDFVAKSKKTLEDKEYELQEIDDGLFVYNTVAFVGKNASGKTSAIELLDCCYSLLGDFGLEDKHYSYDGIELEIHYYKDGNIFKYVAKLSNSPTYNNKATFAYQELYYKKYYKSKVNSIFDDSDFNLYYLHGKLPEDVSMLFDLIEKKQTRAIFYTCDGCGSDTYSLLFKTLKLFKIDTALLASIIRIFDENVKDILMIDEHNYKIIFKNEERVVSDKELFYLLSSGTTKGVLLYTYVVASLQNGFDLLIDEVENHFHKTLVENIISLYKDKTINKRNASLIFTTHYCEVLDLFNRQDNIFVVKNTGKIELSSIYEYGIRPELLKSKQFYNDIFGTAVNYEDLMSLKKQLVKKG